MVSSRKRIGKPVSTHTYLVVDGVTKRVSDWCEDYGIKYETLRARLEKGQDPKTAVTTPVRGKARTLYLPRTLSKWAKDYGTGWMLPQYLDQADKQYSLTDLSKEFSISLVTLKERLGRRWNFWQAVTVPPFTREQVARGEHKLFKFDRNPEIDTVGNMSDNKHVPKNSQTT
ncbi:hypothetical protein [Vibrio phage vB_VpS_PG28]|nr:hypothetical protein [Vibrio phage vB_VpS_PG28]